MSHSTHVGFRLPPTEPGSPRFELVPSALRFRTVPDDVTNGLAVVSRRSKMWSLLVGVGQRTAADNEGPPCRFGASEPRSRVVGVGHNPEPVTSVRGANGCSRYAVPFRVVPALGQVPENSSEPQGKVPWHVLQEHEAGSNVANDSEDFGPKMTLVRLSESRAGEAEGLAWVPACEEVERPELRPVEVAYVADAWGAWPVAFEDAGGVLVDLDLPDASHTGSFQSKIDSPHSGE